MRGRGARLERVVRPARESHPDDPETLLNPLLIVEVLSDSTEAYDRGGKSAYGTWLEPPVAEA